MESLRIYLVRHGQVCNHHERRYNGHHDVDITEEGVRQIERVSDLLAGASIKAVYSSDLKRSRKGAAIVASALGLEPVALAEFRELNFGRWDGLNRDEAERLYPEEAHIGFRDLADTALKGGESIRELSARVLPEVKAAAREHHPGAICMVLHGGVNRVILCDAMGLDIKNFFTIDQGFGCLNVIDVFADGLKVVKLLNGGPNPELGPSGVY